MLDLNAQHTLKLKATDLDDMTRGAVTPGDGNSTEENYDEQADRADEEEADSVPAHKIGPLSIATTILNNNTQVVRTIKSGDKMSIQSDLVSSETTT